MADDSKQCDHTAPCAYTKAHSGIVAILIMLGVFFTNTTSSRMRRMEVEVREAQKKATMAHETLIRQQADLEYIRATVTEIKAKLK